MKLKFITAATLILSGCLSQDRLYTQSNVPLTVDVNTIALWNFNTDSGNSVADLAPNAAVGTATDAPLAAIPGIDPAYGQGRQFNGSSSSLSFGTTATVSKLNFENLSTITFEAMVYVDSANSTVATIFDNGQFQVKIVDGHLAAYVRQVGGWDGLVSQDYLPVSAPTKILASFDSGNLGLAVNDLGSGTVRTRESRIERTHDHSEAILIGANFKGYLDDIRISNISRGDVYAPAITLVSPDLSQPITTPRPNFTFSLSDVGSGIDAASVVVKLNGVVQNGLSITNASISGQFDSDLANGSNEIEVEAIDHAGNHTRYLDTAEGHFPGQEPVPAYVDVDGGFNGCAVAAPDGRVYCWGDNAFGQLLDGTTNNSPFPLKIPGIIGASSIGTGAEHMCALMSNKTVKCWGRNIYGQVGNGTISHSVIVPTTVQGLSDVKQLRLGIRNSCVIDKNNEAQCWGYNEFGQLGTGDTQDRPSPVHIPGFTNVSGIGVGWHFICVMLSNGSVYCAGENILGQLGNGTFANSGTFTQVVGISDAVEISAGNNHACVRTVAGTMKCWGENTYGKLGNQATDNSNVPVDVIGIQNPIRIDAAYNHTCVRTSDGRLLCWGANFSGQLGNGTILGSSTPVEVQNLGPINVFSIGQSVSCALQSDSKLKCWGDNSMGEVGDGTFVNKTTPVEIAFPLDPAPPIPPVPFNKLEASEKNTCGLRQDGKTYCWGLNHRHQSGPSTDQALIAPSLIQGQYTEYSMGFLHTCAVDVSGNVFCWGWNGNGQIGNGLPLFTSTPDPVQIAEISGATKLSAGAEFNCALLSNHTVKCWGDDFVGQLGDGTYQPNQTPQTVMGLSNVAQISSAKKGLHSCAVLQDGSVWCWGNNQRGELGVSPVTTPKSNVPVKVLDIDNAVFVSVNQELSCAILQTGKVKCWGGNSFGQLGTGNTVDSYHPVEVLGLSSVTELSAGDFFACAVNAGTSRCWGKNDLGQLGNGITQNSSFATLAMSGLHSIAVGNSHACGFDIDQRLWCWGDNSAGQFGNGTATSSTIPVKVGL